MVDIKDLVKAGVHFGHQTSRWCPLMAPYIWGHRRGVHLIDVSKTAVGLEKAAVFLSEIAAQAKPILWVGTKKPAQKIVEQVGSSLNMPYVTHRWVGGTLTNHAQVKKAVTKLLHFEDVIAKSDEFHYTKKELNMYQKIVDRLRQTIGGIISLSWPIGALVIVDVKKEQTALREAIVSGVPIVALVDTNSDPSLVDYVIPCNDDSPKSIALITDYLAQAVRKGQTIADMHKQEAKKAKEAAREKKAAEKKAAVAKPASKVAAPSKVVAKPAAKTAAKPAPKAAAPAKVEKKPVAAPAKKEEVKAKPKATSKAKAASKKKEAPVKPVAKKSSAATKKTTIKKATAKK